MGLLDSVGEWIRSKTAPPQVQAQQQPAQPQFVMVKERTPNRFGLYLGVGVVILGFLLTFVKHNDVQQRPVQRAGITPANERQIAAGYRPDEASRQSADDALKAAERGYTGPTSGTPPPGYGQPVNTAAVDPQAAERERMHKSLFASPVVLVAEDAGSSTPAIPSAPAQPSAPPAGAAVSASESAAVAPPTKPSEKHRNDCVDGEQDGEKVWAKCEGDFIDLVLNNRLTGDFTGPVVATVSEDVYSRDRQHLLLPKGTRVLGRAEKVGDQNQSRLAVRFHRILFNNGRGYELTSPGLDQAGDAALKADHINRHLLATFTTSIAMAALAGFATVGTGNYYNASGADMYRQGVAQNLSMQAQQQASQNMSRRMPTIEVDEGHPIKLYLEQDLLLPEYPATMPSIQSNFGGKK